MKNNTNNRCFLVKIIVLILFLFSVKIFTYADNDGSSATEEQPLSLKVKIIPEPENGRYYPLSKHSRMELLKVCLYIQNNSDSTLKNLNIVIREKTKKLLTISDIAPINPYENIEYKLIIPDFENIARKALQDSSAGELKELSFTIAVYGSVIGKIQEKINERCDFIIPVGWELVEKQKQTDNSNDTEIEVSMLSESMYSSNAEPDINAEIPSKPIQIEIKNVEPNTKQDTSAVHIIAAILILFGILIFVIILLHSRKRKDKNTFQDQ